MRVGVGPGLVNRKKATALEYEPKSDKGSSTVTPNESATLINSTEETNDDDNKEGAYDPLTKINIYLSAIVLTLFILIMVFSSREKKRAYYNYKMAQLESMSKSLGVQYNSLYSQYDELTSTIASQVGLITLKHHEEEVGKLQKTQEEVKTKLELKHLTVEELQKEMKANKDELAKVKSELIRKEIDMYDFCDRCMFTGIPGLRATCKARKDYLVQRGAKEDEAVMAIFQMGESCKLLKSAEKQTAADEAVSMTETEEKDFLSKFCGSCKFTAIPELSRYTCQQRLDYVVRGGSPVDVAKIGLMKSDPGCVA